MDLRRQEENIGMPFSVGYNPPIRESPSKVSSSSIPIIVGGGERGRNGNGNGNAAAATAAHSPPEALDNQPLSRARNQDPSPDRPSAGIGAGGSSSRPAISAGKDHVRYRECLKNHAASIGGYVLDGCGEFMPGGEEGRPEALKCAACDCHRNFHRKEIDGESQPSAAHCGYYYHSNDPKNARIRIPQPHPLPLPAPPHLQKFPLVLPTSPPGAMPLPYPSMMMAFGGGSGGVGSGATESSSEDLNPFHSDAAAAQSLLHHPPFALSKKRFRTKFTQEQKDKMLEFAEKVGWRIQKQDELAVEEFCAEVGVKRQVLKVWMHNNKHAMRKQQS